MAFTTDFNIVNGCPDIEVTNNSTYNSTGYLQESDFNYQKVHVSGLASDFSAVVDINAGENSFNAPDCPNILRLRFIQIPDYDFNNIGDISSGDAVYDSINDSIFVSNTDTPGDLYENPGDWDEVTINDLGSINEEYYSDKYCLTYCKASDVFDENFFSALNEVSCLDLECCEELPCEDDIIDSLKIAVIAFDTYFVQGQLGKPVLHTDTFIQNFKDNLELFKLITNMKCDGLYSQ